MTHAPFRIAYWLAALLLALTAAFAQTPTGTLQGTVQDATGAQVPGAGVKIENASTGEVKRLETDGLGHFIQPFLLPGEYHLTVEAKGFRPARQSNIKLDVGQNRSVDFTLSVGQLSDSIEVLAVAPPLDVNTSAVGQIIENKRVVDLPLNGRNPLDLASLTVGVNPTGGGSTPHLGGSRNAVSELQIDGVTNIAPENNIGINDSVYQPQVDSVQEFSVQVNALAAEYGRFGGGVINLVTKSGSNQLHGSAFEFLRNSKLDANDFFANKFGLSKGSFKQNQYGFSLGGPVVKDRTFFFVDMQNTNVRRLSVYNGTVPLPEWRTGNFANLGTTVYDPLTGHVDPQDAGRYVRNPFPGNAIPQERIDPIAAKAIEYYPAPNAGQPGDIAQNYVRSGSDQDNQHLFDVRLDHNVNSRWRLFGRLSHFWSEATPLDTYGNSASPGVAGPGTGNSWSGVIDSTMTLSPTVVANLRYGVGRRVDTRSAFSKGFDVTSLGISPYLAEIAAQRATEFPRFSFAGAGDDLGQGGWADVRMAPMVHSLTGSVTKALARHTIKAGAEYRKLLLNFYQWGVPTGAYDFDRGWTQQEINTYDGSGFPYASFLLGLPGSGYMTHEASPASSSTYMAGYIQDDWKVTSRLTLNVGLRYDLDLPRTERFNQYSYWDPTLPSPLAGKVPAEACAFCGDLRGQMLFVNGTGRYGRAQGPTQWKNLGPRFGLAFEVNSKTVLRAGYGIAYMPSALQAAGSTGSSGMQGFQTDSSMSPTFDNGKTIHATLSNPFPEGLNLPPGRALGAATNLGYSIDESYFDSYRQPYSQQWNANVQRQLPGAITFEISYVGNRGLFLVDGDGGQNYAQLPAADMALGNELYKDVANPFYGLIHAPGSPLSEPQIQYRYLLRPYPQYDGVGSWRKPVATSMYHGVMVRVERRFAQGLSFLMSFTGGKTMDNSSSAVDWLGPIAGSRLDAYNGRLEWSVSSQDVSRRLVTSLVYDLPFGRGQKFLSNPSPALRFLVSGWQANGILTFQTGTPIFIGGAYNNTGIFSGQRPNNNGHSAKLADPTIDRWFDTSVFSQPESFTFGNLSRTLPDVRNPGQANADLSLFKNNYFGREQRLNLQYRLEMFNALNHPQFGAPDNWMDGSSFGVISSTAVAPRQIQMALKLVW